MTFNESNLETAAVPWLADPSVPRVDSDALAPLGDRPIHRAFAGDPRSGAKLEPGGVCGTLPVVAYFGRLYRSFSPQQLLLNFVSVASSHVVAPILIEELTIAAPPKDCGART